MLLSRKALSPSVSAFEIGCHHRVAHLPVKEPLTGDCLLTNGEMQGQWLETDTRQAGAARTV